MAENTLKTHRQAQTHHTTGNNTSTRSLITTARARGNNHQTQPAHKEEPGTGGGVTPETTTSSNRGITHTKTSKNSTTKPSRYIHHKNPQKELRVTTGRHLKC